jgi:5-methylcytosine-specific restriction protein A
MAPRTEKVFRTPASFEAENAARAVIRPFLESRGYQVLGETRKVTGSAQCQSVEVLAPSGEARRIRVKLCWRRGHDRGPNEDKYSAAQLIGRVRDHDWDGALENQRVKDENEGTTHLLLLQHDGSAFAVQGVDLGVVYAALIPRIDVHSVWAKQRAIVEGLLAACALGRMRKNPVVNGDSPTLWLQEDRYPEGRQYADVVWNWSTVEDLVALPRVESLLRGAPVASLGAQVAVDDTWDDISVPPEALGDVGRDAALERVLAQRSGVPRDPLVRRQELGRAGGCCERPGCGARRAFAGFLDVHHIHGIERSDRPWTCVALGPNCHREAHFSPEAEAVARQLEVVAARYRSATGNATRREPPAP